MRILKIALLNIIFYTLFITFTSIAIPFLGSLVVIFVLLFPKRLALRRLRRAISWYGAVIIRILPFPFVRLRVKDYSNNDVAGPYLFVCNHRAASDPFLLGVLPYECIQVANIWTFRLPVLGFVAKLAGYLSVREIPFEDFFKKTCGLLAEGVCIATFPEGTRSRDKSVGQFHGAIFRVALETKRPIVPICITGNESIPPVGSSILRPGLIKIHLLPAIIWEEYRDFSPFKLKNYVRDIIAKEVVLMDEGK
ncbi:MAG: lysophospholipid acyltransferase family protein [Candidatus Omnitrophica bacterium]|nr:lysophospholipid acyltransferase family protein [Candidatus Omnitrophota bacterium]